MYLNKLWKTAVTIKIISHKLKKKQQFIPWWSLWRSVWMLKWENRMLSIFHFNFPHVGQSGVTKGPDVAGRPYNAQVLLKPLPASLNMCTTINVNWLLLVKNHLCTKCMSTFQEPPGVCYCSVVYEIFYEPLFWSEEFFSNQRCFSAYVTT